MAAEVVEECAALYARERLFGGEVGGELRSASAGFAGGRARDLDEVHGCSLISLSAGQSSPTRYSLTTMRFPNNRKFIKREHVEFRKLRALVLLPASLPCSQLAWTTVILLSPPKQFFY